MIVTPMKATGTSANPRSTSPMSGRSPMNTVREFSPLISRKTRISSAVSAVSNNSTIAVNSSDIPPAAPSGPERADSQAVNENHGHEQLGRNSGHHEGLDSGEPSGDYTRAQGIGLGRLRLQGNRCPGVFHTLDFIRAEGKGQRAEVSQKSKSECELLPSLRPLTSKSPLPSALWPAYTVKRL